MDILLNYIGSLFSIIYNVTFFPRILIFILKLASFFIYCPTRTVQVLLDRFDFDFDFQ